MARITQSSFTKYSFTEDEILASATLSDLNHCAIQNKLCEIAELELALDPDPNNYSAFIREKSYLAGQRAILNVLLDESITAQAIISTSQTQGE